ncbi:MAG: radical SAM protein [Nitrospiraceae bacterium]|nr:MAG: radical SAM protein [Nitrospiraceae bacterium]
MKYKKVLLVFPDYKGGHFGALRPPAGLGYIAETLKAHNIEYDVVDMAAGASMEELKEKIDSFRPDLAGISLMTFMYRRSYEIISFIKKVNPSLHIIAGGPHISTLRENVLSECPAMDYGAVLEGEQAILELCRGADPSSIKGLIHKSGDTIIFNSERAFIEDLDKVPFPKFEKFPLNKYVTEEIGIVSSRGCPYGCIYCPVKAAIGRQWRKRSADNIIAEIQYWHNKGYRQFSMLDDNFTFDRDRVIELCSRIRDMNLNGLELNCNNGVRADKVNYEILKHMKEAGFAYLAFGVESGNDRVLKNINKGVKMDVIEKAIQDAISLGFKVTLFFIVGSPGETIHDVRDSVNLAMKYPVFDARFYNLIPFPQSKLYDWVKGNGYFTVDAETYLNNSSQWGDTPVFETPDFSGEERIKALRLVRDVRKKIRYNSMKSSLAPKLGPAAAVAAKVYVNDWVQDKLMKSGALRRNLKKAFMRVSH